MATFRRVLAVLAVAAQLGATGPALADVACVQAALTELGFAPGPVDGALGKRTVNAATLFAGNAGLSLEPLTAQNSQTWCDAITGFAATPAAQKVSRFDLATEPGGILSPRDQKRLWEAYSTASECFEHPTYGRGVAQTVPTRKPEAFAASPWSSPFSSDVRGAKECNVSAGNLRAPKPIPVVKLDEAYGERQQNVDVAANWFRRLTTYARLSSDPVARALLRDAVVDWAEGKALGKGIHVSWGNRPVDYQIMATILSILAAAAEVAGDFSAEERTIVGPWLNELVKQSAASFWKDRQDNKAYMRSYMALLWGLMSGDPQPVQDAILAFKLAIHDMRPDGSWPIDSQRGGMGLHYNASSTGPLVLMAVALHQAHGIDLFGYQVDGRSLHDAVDFVVRGIKDPAKTNPLYAISCPDGGDRFGSLDKPNMHFVEEATGYLLAYAARFPERESSKFIVERMARPEAVDSEKSGGAAACHYALLGGDLTFEPLVMPAPPPELPKAKYAVVTREEIAHRTGRAADVNSLLISEITGAKNGENELDFNVTGSFAYPKEAFLKLSLVINEPLGDKRPAALADCGANTRTYDDGQHRVVIDFTVEGAAYTATQGDCIIDALPRRAAFEAKFLLGSFRDIAIGLVDSGGVENIRHEGLKSSSSALRWENSPSASRPQLLRSARSSTTAQGTASGGKNG